MTPLMMLALTLPPSLAFVIERWMRRGEAHARELSKSQGLQLELVSSRLSLLEGSHADSSSAHAAELKRLGEQISILSERLR